MNAFPSNVFKFYISARFIEVMAAKAAFLFCSSRWVENLDGAEVVHIMVIKELTMIPAMRNLNHNRERATVNSVTY